MSVNVGWSQVYESFIYDCIYGCREVDFESTHEAEQAFIKHTCRSAGS
jgi:hypothetical protein